MSEIRVKDNEMCIRDRRQEVRRKHLKTGADALEALKGIIREMLRADGEMQL